MKSLHNLLKCKLSKSKLGSVHNKHFMFIIQSMQ